MWNTFLIDDDMYMLKFKQCDHDYEIHLTNMKQIWSSKISESLLIERFKECNPAIEAHDSEILTYILEILNDIGEGESAVTSQDHIVKLKMKTNLSGATNSKYKMKYELELIDAQNQLFTEAVTVPLVQTIIILEKQQQMMSNLLKKKDRELEEYQMEKGDISRTDLITERFQPEMLISSSNKLMLNLFGKYTDQIANKYGSIEEKVAEVEVESWNVVKRKRKIYNKETAEKTKSKKIVFRGETSV